MLRMKLYQRYVFIVFGNIVTDSFTGVLVCGETLLPRTGTSCWLQISTRNESFFESSVAIRSPAARLHSPNRIEYHYTSRAETLPDLYNHLSLEEIEPRLRRSNRRTIPNTIENLYMALQTRSNLPRTIFRQMSVGKQNQKINLEATILSSYRKLLIKQRAHEWPQALEYSASSSSHKYKLYRIISLEKLHEMDLGIIRQYCDLNDNVTQCD